MNRTRASKVSTTAWYNSSTMFLNRVAPSLVHDYASNRYYNTADGETAFPFTATRTTNAMQFDAQGRLVWAPANMLTNTETFGSGWSSSGSSISAAGILSPAGTAYKLIESAVSVLHAYQSQAASIVTGQDYTASIYFKAAERGFAMMAMAAYFTTTAIEVNLTTGAVTVGTGTPVSYGSQDCGNGWWRVWITQTATSSGSGSTALLVYTSQDGVWNNRSYLGDGTSGIYMAAAQFEPTDVTSPKSYVAAGTSSYFGPRFDYDPVTLQPRGILIEESRTNILSNSNGTSGWVITDVTSSKTLTGVERVANTAYSMIEGTTGTAICTPAGSGVTVTAGATLTVSGVFKYQNQQWLRIRVFNNTGVDGVNLWIDVLNGVIGSNSVGGAGVYVSSRVTNLGDGWFRFELTGTPNASYTSAIFQIVSATADGSSTRVNNATYGLQWPMMEEKPTASLSIIPTYGGATATKAADNLSTTSIGWLNQAVGTWYGSVIASNDLSATRRIIAVNDGTTANQYIVVRTTTRGGQIVTSVAGVSDAVTTGTMNDITSSKIAARLNSPSKSLCVNGAAVSTVSATAFNTSGYTQFRVGSTAASTSVWQGWVKEIRYYADASASDAQLQALTA